jgi:hypothetical protein
MVCNYTANDTDALFAVWGKADTAEEIRQAIQAE